MTADLARRIETTIDRSASAAFAAAVGFAIFALLGQFLSLQLLGAAMAAAVAISYLVCNRALNALGGRGKRLPVAVFDVRTIESFEPNELLLTEADRAPATADEVGDAALVLDDILAELGPDSRVVRLFDPAAMPTPGELKSRIDGHLDTRSAQSLDATQALHDALAELRRRVR